MIRLPDVVPFAGACGIEQVTAERGQVVLRMPSRSRNRDHAGTIHPVAVTGLAHVAASAVLALNFDLRYVHFRTHDLRTRFLRPARSALLCAAVLPDGDRRRIDAALERDGRADHVVATAVRTVEGETVAEVEVTFLFRSQP